MPPHPFASLHPRRLLRLFWLVFAGAVAVMIIMQIIGRLLQTPAAPMGIVSFEFARTPANAQAMVDSWGALARIHAGFSLGFDYLFMPLYSTAIGLACLWGGRALHRRGWRLAGLGGWLAWGLWLAALCDAIENLALWQLLIAPAAPPWPALAWWMATIKFALILLGLLYYLFALIVRIGVRAGDE
jgi:hypothetical protein